MLEQAGRRRVGVEYRDDAADGSEKLDLDVALDRLDEQVANGEPGQQQGQPDPDRGEAQQAATDGDRAQLAPPMA
jgi:hypothetical protein